MLINEEFESVLDTLATISDKYFCEGRLNDAVGILEHGYQIAQYEDVPQESRFDLLLAYGALLADEAWLITGDYHKAEKVVTQLEELEQNPTQKGKMLSLKGNIMRQQALNSSERDFIVPRKILAESVALLEDKSLPKAYFRPLFRMGICDQFMGEYESAMEIFQNAEKIAREHDFKRELSYVARHIGFVYQFTEQLDDALVALEESLALRQELGFQIFLGLSHLAVANVLHQLDRQVEAKQQYEMAIRTGDIVGLTRSKMIIRANFGRALFEYGELEKAKAYLLEAKTFAEDIQHAGVLKLTEELLEKIGN